MRQTAISRQLRRTHLRVRKTAGVLMVAVAVIAGAGCSSGSTSSTTSTASAAPSSPSPASASASTLTGAPLRIGVVCACSGTQSTPLVATYDQAWEKWVNAHGGINGYPVKLYIVDDVNDPTKSATGFRLLVSQDHVQAIAGYFTPQAAAWASDAQADGIPVIGSPGVNVAEYSNPIFFPTGIAQVQSAYASAASAKFYGVPKIGVMYCTEAPICAQVPVLLTNFAKFVGGGVKIVATAAISGSQPSYAAQCLALKSAGAQSLIVASAAPVVLRVIQQCVQQGWKPFDLSFSGGIGHNDPPNLDNIHVALTTQQIGLGDTSTSGGRQMNEIISAYAPGIPSSSQYSDAIGAANASLEMFAAAATAAKLTPASAPSVLLQGLYSLKNETLGGLIAPITYTTGKPTFARCWFYDLYNGNTWQINTTPQCMPAAAAGAIQAALGSH
jgi:branched-chain amino acid transport system substrate-binding protein